MVQYWFVFFLYGLCKLDPWADGAGEGEGLLERYVEVASDM